METVNQIPEAESLEGRLLFAVSTVDLVIAKVAAPTTSIFISRGHVDSQPATARVQNLAQVPVRTKFTIQFYFSTDQTFDSNDMLVGRASARTALRAGGSKGIAGTLQPNANTPDGKYYLFAVLKLPAGIANSDTAGNIALAARRVSVIHGNGSNPLASANDSSSLCDISGLCLDTTDVAPPASEDNAPTDTQPAPESQPATPPASDSQPTTQPTPDPASNDPAPSDPASDPSPSGDSSSDGGDSGSD